MRASEFITERWVSNKTCKSPKKLGNSDQSQCIARGLRARQDRKTINGKKVFGKYIKSAKYGGPIKGNKGDK